MEHTSVAYFTLKFRADVATCRGNLAKVFLFFCNEYTMHRTQTQCRIQLSVTCAWFDVHENTGRPARENTFKMETLPFIIAFATFSHFSPSSALTLSHSLTHSLTHDYTINGSLKNAKEREREREIRAREEGRRREKEREGEERRKLVYNYLDFHFPPNS